MKAGAKWIGAALWCGIAFGSTPLIVSPVGWFYGVLMVLAVIGPWCWPDDIGARRWWQKIIPTAGGAVAVTWLIFGWFITTRAVVWWIVYDYPTAIARSGSPLPAVFAVDAVVGLAIGGGIVVKEVQESRQRPR